MNITELFDKLGKISQPNVKTINLTTDQDPDIAVLLEFNYENNENDKIHISILEIRDILAYQDLTYDFVEYRYSINLDLKIGDYSDKVAARGQNSNRIYEIIIEQLDVVYIKFLEKYEPDKVEMIEILKEISQILKDYIK